MEIIRNLHSFADNDRVKRLDEFLAEKKPEHFYPCHCMDFKAKALLNNFLRVRKCGVGLRLGWELNETMKN